MKHLLIEHGELALDENCADFCGFVCEKLGLSHCPPITFVKHTGNASFGSYSPSEGTIVVATSGRHEADVLRTLAHELVHDHQITTGVEMTLEEMEFEANAIAGLLMRDWNKAHPELYGVTHSDNADGVEGESWGGDPTRPSGPINMAEQQEIVLWGLPKGETDRLHERVLSTQCKTKTDLDAIKTRASKDGWHSFRTSKLDLTKKPDFVKALHEDAIVNSAGSGDIAGIGEDYPGHYRGLEDITGRYRELSGEKPRTKIFRWFRYGHHRRKGTRKPTNFGMTAAEKAKKTVNEDAMGAPTNSAGSGQIAGIGVGPQGEPGIKKSKMIRRKPKSALAQIFTGFPKPPKLFKEYKAEIAKKIDWDKDSVPFRQTLVKKKKTLASLGLPHKSLRQILRGR